MNNAGIEIHHEYREYGPNLFSVEGDEWKRQRRILNPAFSPATYALVWDEAGRTYNEMVTAEGWDKRQEISIPTPEDITMKVSPPLAWLTRRVVLRLFANAVRPDYHLSLRLRASSILGFLQGCPRQHEFRPSPRHRRAQSHRALDSPSVGVPFPYRKVRGHLHFIRLPVFRLISALQYPETRSRAQNVGQVHEESHSIQAREHQAGRCT